MYKLIVVFALFLPTWAFANCNGVDQTSGIQRNDPTGYERIVAAASALPNGNGVMWKVSKTGLSDSYLIGTNHVVSSVAKTFIGTFKAVLPSARVLLVELSKAEEAEMTEAMGTNPNLIFDMSGRMLVDYLPPEDHALAEEAFASLGLDFTTGSRLSPTFIQILTAIPVCAQVAAAQNPELKMDSVLMATAEAADVPVVGLETWERQISAFSKQPRDVLEDSARISLQLWRNIEDNFATVEAMYQRGEIANIWEYSRYISEAVADVDVVDRAMAAVQVELLDRRNIEMAESAAGYLKEGGAVVAVGALHLIGEVGLVELVRKQGYTVERIK
ncbi:MAG: TraB/GumN family protein [Pikeienuella sp.]